MMMMHPWRSRIHLKIHLNPYFTYVDTTYDYIYTRRTPTPEQCTPMPHITLYHMVIRKHTPRVRSPTTHGFYIGQTRVSYSRAHTHESRNAPSMAPWHLAKGAPSRAAFSDAHARRTTRDTERPVRFRRI